MPMAGITSPFRRVKVMRDEGRRSDCSDGVDVFGAKGLVMLPHHVNIDSMTIRPIAQAANHKVHRVK